MGSVSKPRCAKGENCYHVRELRSEKPPTVAHEGDLCRRCEQAASEGSASGHEELLKPASSQEAGYLQVLRRNDKYCLFCGRYWGQLRTWGQILDQTDGDQPLYFCEECAALVRRGGTMRRHFVWEIGPAVPLEERFGGLFRAARALLREGAHEDRILPTLAVEGLEIHAGKDQEPWSQEAADFYADHPRVRPVRPELLEEGILILERREADVGVALEGETIVISIAPRSKPPTETEVASAYKRAMTSWGKPFGIEYKFSLDVEEQYHILNLRFSPIPPFLHGRDHPVNYPSPERVADVCRGLLGGEMGKRLEMRETGPGGKADNLVLGIVAFYLRTYGGLHGHKHVRKQIHTLLNEHVLCERPWKLDVGTTGSRERKLWDSVERFHKHLVREMYAL